MTLNTASKIYIVGVLLAAIALVAVSAMFFPIIGLAPWGLWLAFAVLMALSVHYPVYPRPGWQIQLDTIPTFAALLLFPPVAFIAICGLGVVAGSRRNGIGALGVVFNTSQKLIAACAATLILHYFSSIPWNPTNILAWAGMLSSSVVLVLVSSLLVSGMLSLENRLPFFTQWFAGVERSSGPEGMMLALGLLSALVVSTYSWSLILLAIAGIGMYLAIDRLTHLQTQQNSLADSNARLASDLNETMERLKETNLELEAVSVVTIELRKTQNRGEILPIISDLICRELRSGSSLVIIKDPETGEMVCEAARGKWIRTQGQCLAAGIGVNGKIIQNGQTYVQKDVRQDSAFTTRQWMDGDFSVAGVPLVVQDAVIGILWAGRETGFDSRELHLMLKIADSCANALHHILLFDRVQHNNEDLSAMNREITAAYDSTLEEWARALEMRDGETQGHSDRVCQLTLRLGRVIGMSQESLAHLYRGALLHDIGKMRTPDQILNKKAPLNEEEWVIMRRHPQDAYAMLAPIAYLKPALAIPYSHHEKWDGSGYPRGLKGKRIPLAARIFAVVDVWDALTHDRPYRAAWSPEKALDYIRRQSGAHFDPQVVELFLMMIEQGVPETRATTFSHMD
jgi:HD-GYP domain-containing protein (c-di-GMP phosphodiesterase class II)